MALPIWKNILTHSSESIHFERFTPMRNIITISAILPLAVQLSFARENWPVPDDKIRTRDAAWNLYEQQVIANIAPQLAEWEKKGKPFIPWASKPEDLPQAKVPAFPGAEGGGKYSFGGRGGKVYVVTNLADSGPGTLREACESAGPRIVIFNVAEIGRAHV